MRIRVLTILIVIGRNRECIIGTLGLNSMIRDGNSPQALEHEIRIHTYLYNIMYILKTIIFAENFILIFFIEFRD